MTFSWVITSVLVMLFSRRSNLASMRMGAFIPIHISSGCLREMYDNETQNVTYTTVTDFKYKSWLYNAFSSYTPFDDTFLQICIPLFITQKVQMARLMLNPRRVHRGQITPVLAER